MIRPKHLAICLFQCAVLTGSLCGANKGDGLEFVGKRETRSADVSGDLYDAKILHVLLKLRNNTAAEDARVVEALSELRWFTHIMLVVPSWQEKPNAIHHELVVKAIKTCRERGIGVIWGRWLWVAWPGSQRQLPNEQSYLDSEFYATAIRTVKHEAKSIGTKWTMLDLEPYGKSVQKPTLKFHDHTPAELRKIQGVVMKATKKAGRVTLITPTSSMRSSHYAWSLLKLADYRCDSKTYYTRSSSRNRPVVRPAPGCDHRVDYFGSNVGLGRSQDVLKKQRLLTAAEVVAYDLKAIRLRYPECRGQWVWVSHDILPDVIRTWPK